MTSHYEWDARAYERHSEGQLKWALELMDKINWTGRESVIDLGCGDGKVTARLAGRVPRGRVLGIDSAPPMIDLAVKKYPPSAYPNLAFRKMDVRDLDFQEEFDVAFSNAALHWVKDQRNVLIRVAKALRPGGRIQFQMEEQATPVWSWRFWTSWSFKSVGGSGSPALISHTVFIIRGIMTPGCTRRG